MINNYDIFKDDTLNCYQIRTKSNSYMVEFDEEESEQIFLSIVNTLNKNENIWISVHGLGVDYLHIRISNNPKYYEKSTLQKIPKIINK